MYSSDIVPKISSDICAASPLGESSADDTLITATELFPILFTTPSAKFSLVGFGFPYGDIVGDLGDSEGSDDGGILVDEGAFVGGDEQNSGLGLL